MTIKSQALKAGEIQLDAIELMNYKEERVDLRFCFSEINIYEDIFANCLSGSIVISESVDLMSSLPIIGEERLLIMYSTPGFDERIELEFYVYKVTDEVKTNTNARVFILHFMSYEGIIDCNLKISKSIKGNVADVATDIISSDVFLGSNKKILYDKTANDISFVAPYWSPFKILNWLASNAISKDNPMTSDFLFYETTKGFEFTSLNTLCDKEYDVKSSFYYSDTDGRSNNFKDLDEAYSKIRSYNMDDYLDYLKRIDCGLYKGTLFVHDIINKKFQTRTFDYSTDFNKSNHLNEYQIGTPKKISKKTGYQAYYSRNEYAKTEYRKDFAERIVLSRNSRFQQLEAQKLQITVAGRSDIIVGDTIDVNFPTNTTASKDSYLGIDRYMSGKYLITAINHRIRVDDYQMVIEIAKDSLIRSID
jgi:hypothetical protein